MGRFGGRGAVADGVACWTRRSGYGGASWLLGRFGQGELVDGAIWLRWCGFCQWSEVVDGANWLDGRVEVVMMGRVGCWGDSVTIGRFCLWSDLVMIWRVGCWGDVV